MNLTNKEYEELNKKASKPTKHFGTLTGAFLIGGGICSLGELLAHVYMNYGMVMKDAYMLVSITLIFISSLLTGLKLYDSIAKYAGAGSLVPITGFANAIVSPALEYKSEGYIMGIGGKMFTIAGPVIVYGISVSVLYGLILFIFQSI
ncbi:MAG: stage V sporulation protein AC [Oscillospiraceae bacterium]|nr:stage V sporulation protein AC [Oscillospiraceae bacterium]